MQRTAPDVLRDVLRALALPLLVLLVTASAAVAGEPDAKEVARLKAEMALRAAVPGAVERAAAWLWRQQREDGTFSFVPDKGEPGAVHPGTHRFGESALAALALAHAGVGPKDARMAKTLAYLRSRWRDLLTRERGAQFAATYSLSLYAMLIHTLQREFGAPPEAQRARRNPCGLGAVELEIMRSIARWLLETRVRDSLWSYPFPEVKPTRAARRRWPQGARIPDGTRVDLSNTQYALLGLWACARCGAAVPKKDALEIAEALLRWQVRGGPAVRRRLDPAPGEDPGAHVYSRTDRARGFGYTPASPGVASMQTGSMTAGGLSSLLIAKAILWEQHEIPERLERRLDHGIWDAIAWLAKHFSVARNPQSIDVAGLPVEQAHLLGKRVPDLGGMWHGYYLYGLERACVIAGKRYLGEHDWYAEGARFLLDRQGEDGHWRPHVPKKPADAPPGVLLPQLTGGELLQTCFAVLFLRRATLRPSAPLIEVHAPDEEVRPVAK